MGTPLKHPPVRLIVGILTAFPDLFGLVRELCETEFGPADLVSPVFDFGFTDYYEKEMGKDIKRRFLSFRNLIEPDSLPDVKLKTNALEQQIASGNPRGVSRPVNLDPGFVSLSKLVLASTKDYAHRIYLRDGIYAEVTLSYRARAARFEPMPWTYPDYRTEGYQEVFMKVRGAYRAQLPMCEP